MLKTLYPGVYVNIYCSWLSVGRLAGVLEIHTRNVIVLTLSAALYWIKYILDYTGLIA